MDQDQYGAKTGIPDCYARAASSDAAAALPGRVMNARRLMRLPKPEDDSLPHESELLCSIASWIAPLPDLVNSSL
jgi:hypothetical protein